MTLMTLQNRQVSGKFLHRSKRWIQSVFTEAKVSFFFIGYQGQDAIFGAVYAHKGRTKKLEQQKRGPQTQTSLEVKEARHNTETSSTK